MKLVQKSHHVWWMIETNSRKPMTTMIPSRQVLGSFSLPINRQEKYEKKGHELERKYKEREREEEIKEF